MDMVDIKAHRSNPHAFRALLEVKVGKESRARTWCIDENGMR